MDFEWNPRKEEINRKKHNIFFNEASSVFGDTLSITYPDPDHSTQEERFIIIGLSCKHRVLVISYTYRSETIRIITARVATKREKRFYEYGQ
jgi:uncharacterized DUF497 family protein